MDAVDSVEPITVNVVPTFKEYLQFNFRVLYRRSRFLVFFAFFWLVVFATAPIVLRSESMVKSLPALILPVAVFIALPAATYYGVRMRWNAAKELREPKTYTFGADGVQVSAESFRSFTAWSNITSAERHGGLILLGTAQQLFHLIPVEAFGSNESLAQFTRLVESKVSKSKL